MSVSFSSSRWFSWLRNVVVAVALAFGVTWGLAGLFTPPLSEIKKSVKMDPSTLAAAKALDAEFGADWAKKGVQVAARADDLVIARRLSLALTGSIPSLQEIRELEAAKPTDAASWWLARLLADRRTSDYLAERLVRVYVGIENGPFLIYRRRRLVEWLSDALQKNRPYDEIARALIDAQGVWTTNPAVNFVSVTNENNKGPDETKLAGRVSRAFLGVQMDCVQCHDGKLGSTWKQEDFHKLAAFFGQADFQLNGLTDNPKDSYKYRYLGKTEDEVVPAAVPWKAELLPEKGTPRKKLALWVTAKDNKAFSRTMVNRMWALLFNKPLVTPVDDIPLDGPFPAGMEMMSEDFIAHGFDLQRLIRVITATRVFQMSSQSEHGMPEDCWAVFPLTRLRPEQMAGSVIQAASLSTLDAETHVVFRIKRDLDVANFVKRYGDSGEDRFDDSGGTIPQRLLLMNGNMVSDNTKNNPLVNASTRVGLLAPNDSEAVETAYLSIFSRRPTAEEADHFKGLLAKAKSGGERTNAMSDLYWTLMNATEFSWNH